MESYLKGAPFKVDIIECYFHESENKLKYRLVILDKDNTHSTVKFRIQTSILYYVPVLNVNQYYKFVPEVTTIYEPGNQQVSELDLNRIFEKTDEIFVKNQTFYEVTFFSISKTPQKSNIFICMRNHQNHTFSSQKPSKANILISKSYKINIFLSKNHQNHTFQLKISKNQTFFSQI